MGSGFNKGTYLPMRLALGGCKMGRSLHLHDRILKFYVGALPGFSHVCFPDGLNSMLLSPSCILENVFSSENCRQNVHSKGRGGGKEPLIVQVQLRGQLVVMSSG